MIEEHEARYCFDFTVAHIGKWSIDGTTIRIPMRKLGVLGGCFGFEKTADFRSCTLVYEGVVKSERRIYEYSTWERHEFKSKHMILDGPFPSNQTTVYLYPLEGISNSLNAYISWHIVAESVHLEDMIEMSE